MNPHSAGWWQCNARIPPAPRRMFTPEMVLDIWKSAWVTWRAQPPFWTHRGALLKDAQNSGRSPMSVGGGVNAFGNWLAIGWFCGPGSTIPRGFAWALTTPCGGSAGLPKVAAFV